MIEINFLYEVAGAAELDNYYISVQLVPLSEHNISP
jgi:hypothetical protein